MPRKSISVAALLRPKHATARAVLLAHVAAVEAVTKELPVCVLPRSGTPPTRWIAINFHHTHTREGDPHLHTHLILPNLAQNSAGNWRAIQIGGHLRQRLELRYGPELASRLRRAGLGHEIVMRSNGLPELQGLLGLGKTFSKAAQAIKAAGVQIHPTTDTPAGGPFAQVGRSGLPVHPQRSAIRMRQSIADSIRKPKAKASDDPATLREEAGRWTSQFTNAQVRAYLNYLEENSAEAERRRIAQGRPGPGTLVLHAPLPALRRLILEARRNHLRDG